MQSESETTCVTDPSIKDNFGQTSNKDWISLELQTTYENINNLFHFNVCKYYTSFWLCYFLATYHTKHRSIFMLVSISKLIQIPIENEIENKYITDPSIKHKFKQLYNNDWISKKLQPIYENINNIFLKEDFQLR